MIPSRLHLLAVFTFWNVVATSPCDGEEWGREVELDFSAGHSAKILEQADADFTKDTVSSANRTSYSLNKQELRIRLPGGRTIHQKIERGSASAKDEMMETLATTGPVLPLKEAYQIAKDFHAAFGIPTDRIEEWFHEAESPDRRAKSFGNVAPNHYPAVHIQIHRSMNPKYPWYVRLSVGWNAPRHKGWDEERARIENSKPPEGKATLSLDSPSGQVYAEGEAFEHLNDAQARLDQELGQIRDPTGKLIENDDTTTSPKAPTANQGDEHPQPHYAQYIVALIIVILASGALFLIKQKR
ncbi:MAG: hypothetical protein O3A87_07565 [Verrucomicrobia bacterium]|nr:hypothetical protein [Verrucomicrobiota bacterium]MDA1006325.1 hypothetical protein [Verrucomicrobiota bacterium]